MLTDVNRFVNNIMRSIDSNFSLHSKLKKTDPDDKELITSAYFPDNEQYQRHLNLAGDTATVSNILYS